MRPSPAIALLLLLAAAPVAAQDHAPTAPPFAVPAQLSASDSISYRARVMNGNLVGVTVTNYGFIGNNFISREPSLEYPLGAGYEHLVRGGLWIGALARDGGGGFTGVTSATVDGAQGSASQGATEFTPAGREIKFRSSIKSNDDYSLDAVSWLDAISTFSDRPAKRGVANSSQDHRPLGVIVRQENYSWAFAQYDHSLFFHYVIKNDGLPLRNVWVGIYTEMASGAKKDYAVWPPSAWYKKKWLETDDTLHVSTPDTCCRLIPPMVREHYCASLPTPTGCNLANTPYWVGVKLLGSKRSVADNVLEKSTTLSAWGYAPGDTARNEDTERYALMNTGVLQPLVGDNLVPGGDPVELLCTGPFSYIDSGDQIEVDFAIVGGAEVKDIQEHARFAQRAYDRHYKFPLPPDPPRVRVVSRHNALDVFWDKSPESSQDPTSPVIYDFEGYRVYLGDERHDLRRLAQFDLAGGVHDTTGFNTGFRRIAVDTTFDDGRHYDYRYRIDNLRDGFKYFVAVTAYDLGTDETESLDSGISSNNKLVAIPGPAPDEAAPGDRVTVFPNPYRVEARWDQGSLVRDHYLWFANLPPKAGIKIFTLAGDLVYEVEFDGASYRGTDARGVFDPSRELDVKGIQLSGRSYAWNMITSQGQAAATGLYLYSVEDRATGKRQVGKFLIVKSDREGF